jgi:hypothetical protein
MPPLHDRPRRTAGALQSSCPIPPSHDEHEVIRRHAAGEHGVELGKAAGLRNHAGGGEGKNSTSSM